MPPNTKGNFPNDLESLRKAGNLKDHKTCWTSEKSYDESYKVAADKRSCSVGCDVHPPSAEQPVWKSP